MSTTTATPRRPRRFPTIHINTARLHDSVRRHRWDDRPEIERNASPSEVAVRPYARFGSPRST